MSSDIHKEVVFISGNAIELTIRKVEWNKTLLVVSKYLNVYTKNYMGWKNVSHCLLSLSLNAPFYTKEDIETTITKITKALRNKSNSLRFHDSNEGSYYNLCNSFKYSHPSVSNLKLSKSLSFDEGNYFGNRGKRTLDLMEALSAQYVYGFCLKKKKWYRTFSMGIKDSEKIEWFNSKEEFYNKVIGKRGSHPCNYYLVDNQISFFERQIEYLESKTLKNETK